MFKVRDIAVGTFLVIIGVLCLSKILCGQESGVYSVENYHGGLNVATDGTNLRPDESLTLTNLTLDTVGVLVPRQGFSYWDSAAVKADSEIQAIYIYEPYIDTMRMVIAVGGFVYLNDNLTDPGNVNWDTLRLSFTGDSLDATASATTIQTDLSKDPWWYLNTWGDNVTGDHIIVDEDNSETEYDIQKISWVNDSKMTITPAYAGTTGTLMNYTVYKKIHGNPFITQFRNELYICDSDGFPIIYDDTSYSFTASLDSGVISAAVSLNETLTVYSTGKAKVRYNQNKVDGNSDVVWQPSWGDSTWEFTIHTRKPKAQRGSRRSKNPDDLEDVSWSSKIIGVDSTERVLTLENTYPWAVIDLWNDYEIKTIYYMCVLDSGLAVIDSSKNWMDIHLGDNYLTGLRAVFEGVTFYGMYYNKMIGCNSDIALAVPKKDVDTLGIVAGKAYYIFAGGVPYQFTSFVTEDTRMEYPRFRQVAFYNNQLFGLGERKLVGNYSLASGIRADHDVIWYSYPSIPRYSPALDYNFSIDENEANTVFLSLRNNLYIGTENSIWGYFGVMGESFLRKVVSDNGIPDFDNCVKASEEYGYFTNRTGVYRFDGVRPQKISWRVDPIIKNNYASRIVMGYQDYRLYISFPDSNFTMVYHEGFDAWTKLDFGMTCFYAPADTNIFYFGHSQFKGRVYYYPNGLFQDIVAIDDTNDIVIEYESGWQAYGGYWKLKRVAGGIDQDAYFQVKNSNSLTIKIYTDFSVTACDTVLCDSTGRFVYRKQFDNDCVGEYFKVGFSGTVDALAIFGGYRIEWTEGIPRQK